MSAEEEMTHYVGDDCPGGHRDDPWADKFGQEVARAFEEQQTVTDVPLVHLALYEQVVAERDELYGEMLRVDKLFYDQRVAERDEARYNEKTAMDAARNAARVCRKRTVELEEAKQRIHQLEAELQAVIENRDLTAEERDEFLDERDLARVAAQVACDHRDKAVKSGDEMLKQRDEARGVVIRLREFLGYFPVRNVHPPEDLERFQALCEDLDNIDWLEVNDDV